MKKIILIGNPNTGKTTLFNTLTGASEHVGNWHGVTVDVKERTFLSVKNVVLVDLPGLYSLDAFSPEEKISADFLKQNKNSLVINICDANNLSRNLYLTMQLLERGLNVCLAINMAKELKGGAKIFEKIESVLGVKVFPIDARKKRSCKKLVNFCLDYAGTSDQKRDKKIGAETLTECHTLAAERTVTEGHALVAERTVTGQHTSTAEHTATGQHTSTAERTVAEHHTSVSTQQRINKDTSRCAGKDKAMGAVTDTALKNLAKERYAKIDALLMRVGVSKAGEYGKSKLDRVLFNRFGAVAVFIALFAVIFFVTFGQFGATLSGAVCNGFAFVKNLLFPFLAAESGNWFFSFLNDGVFGGAVSVLSFLPQIMLLFLFINLLEDIGYLSRVAFMLDGKLARVGLTGRAVFSLLMGFGCTTSAAITTRNLDDKLLRRRTTLMLPNFSCSAKLPIFACICGVFLKNISVFAVFALYLLGVGVSLIIALISAKVDGRKAGNSVSPSFLMEMPKMRAPSISKILKAVWGHAKEFVVRVGSVILAMSILVWFINSFNFKLQFVGAEGNTILKFLGHILAPVFAPLGFNSDAIAVALLTGLVAKEMVLGALVLANGAAGVQALGATLINPLSPAHFSAASAISFLVFVLLYPSCISSISAIRKEMGKKTMWLSVGLQFGIAYVMSFITYEISKNGLWGVLGLGAVVAIVLAICVRRVVNYIKKGCKGDCHACRKQHNNIKG